MGTSPYRNDFKGRSLAGRDLSGTDFTGADLRGADFSGCTLRGAVFRSARTGLGARAVAARAALGAALGCASGFAASCTGAWIRGALLGDRPGMKVLALFMLSEVILYVVATVGWGARFAMEHVALPVVSVIVLGGVLTVVSGLGGARDLGSATAAAACLLLVAAAIEAGAVARSAAHSGGKWLIWFVLLATVVGVRLSTGLGVAATVAVVATLVALRAERGGARGGTAKIAVQRTMTWGGTSFRGADLEGADFGDARLRNTDFRGARTGGTRWNEPLEVSFCRFDAGLQAPPAKVKGRARVGKALFDVKDARRAPSV
ncbi:MAG TPA: pentapeptide repeat-containing protein [Polyangiaceae bacterium]|nr:pentapeptide repeat-containing protein [Polyangiaceae bacterium]